MTTNIGTAYNFITNEQDGRIEAVDVWICYRNQQGGIRIIPTAKSLTAWSCARLKANMRALVPTWSIF